MKKFLKVSLIWVALSFLMGIYWIIGMMLGNDVFPSIIPESPDEGMGTELWLLIICLINTAAVLFFMYNSTISGIRLVLSLMILIFGIQFFMSQIETVWFNDSLKMDINTIRMVVMGGAFMSILFSMTATWMTGKWKSNGQKKSLFPPKLLDIMVPVALLCILIWPLVYFLAGYFIAWQFPEIREYYSGSKELESFFVIMRENVISGLYFFQILRGVIWILLASLALVVTSGSWHKKGLILGLLLSFLGCSQLLLPNPIMPEQVRLGHLLETSTSSFIWGFILAWFLSKHFVVRGHGERFINLNSQTTQ